MAVVVRGEVGGLIVDVLGREGRKGGREVKSSEVKWVRGRKKKSDNLHDDGVSHDGAFVPVDNASARAACIVDSNYDFALAAPPA
jgi:hypothetical protein